MLYPTELLVPMSGFTGLGALSPELLLAQDLLLCIPIEPRPKALSPTQGFRAGSGTATRLWITAVSLGLCLSEPCLPVVSAGRVPVEANYLIRRHYRTHCEALAHG